MPNSTADKFTGGFSISAFEPIASGVARNEKAWRALSADERPDRLVAATKELWGDDVFMRRSGGGKSASLRIPYMVEVGARILAKHAE